MWLNRRLIDRLLAVADVRVGGRVPARGRREPDSPQLAEDERLVLLLPQQRATSQQAVHGHAHIRGCVYVRQRGAVSR